MPDAICVCRFFLCRRTISHLLLRNNSPHNSGYLARYRVPFCTRSGPVHADSNCCVTQLQRRYASKAIPARFPSTGPPSDLLEAKPSTFSQTYREALSLVQVLSSTTFLTRGRFTLHVSELLNCWRSRLILRCKFTLYLHSFFLFSTIVASFLCDNSTCHPLCI